MQQTAEIHFQVRLVQKLLSFVGSFVSYWAALGAETPMKLRLFLWTLCLAYVGFVLAGGRNASSITIMVGAALIGAASGFGLGTMFNRRAARKQI